mgnify:CR=1 FL=1
MDDAGDLVLGRGDSEVRLKKPVMYQETDGHRVEIPGGYRTTASDRGCLQSRAVRLDEATGC